MEIEEIRADIAAFADREEDVVIDKNGSVLFERDRQPVECKLLKSPGGIIDVQINDRKIPYSKFIAEELGRLSVLAEAIKQKRADVSPYIDTRAHLVGTDDSTIQLDSGLTLLSERCQERGFGATKLVFLTADAGEGKTALLRRLARKSAEDYLTGDNPWLLLHVDTQGRSFVRLEEAVAKDLGQLRISGLFYSGIVRLVRHGLITIAIDGFDELLAEIGSGEAYSGLGAFLKQLDGQGAVIAAARSAYFESENYTAQSHLLLSLPNTQVDVEQMKLQRWERKQTVHFFREYSHSSGRKIEDPAGVYDHLTAMLGPKHLVLHSPFLVSQMAALLAAKLMTPAEFKDEIGPSGLTVVPKVIKSFLRREVGEKWRDVNGRPYLTIEQHIRLLAMVADEIWHQSTNSLSVELVQLIAETLIEEWALPQKDRVQVVERVKAHALLPNAAASGQQTFEHEEFLNYFLAERLDELLMDREHDGTLRAFLGKHSLPKIVGKWTGLVRERSADESRHLISHLNLLSAQELRSTYLRQNLGLIASNVVSACEDLSRVDLRAMYFEGDEWKGSKLNNIMFDRCTFLDVVLSDCVWSDCRFAGCQIDGLTYNEGTRLDNTEFDENSRVVGIVSDQDISKDLRTYVPERCQIILESLGARFPLREEPRPQIAAVPKDIRKCLDAFLRIFSRTTGASESLIDLKLGKRAPFFRKHVLPGLVDHDLVRETKYRGKGHQGRFELVYPVQQILKAEDPAASLPNNLTEFWNELRSGDK